MAKHKSDKTAAREVGVLDRSPSHLLHRVLQTALDIYVEETGAGAITQRQFAVLAAVAQHEGVTQTGLVKATGIDRSTLADMVARMIAKGHLERQRSEQDARANSVRLTEAGRLILEESLPRVAAADARILSLLKAGKRDGFLDLLAEMAAVDLTAPRPEPKAKKAKKDKAEKAEKADKPKKEKKAKKDKDAKKAA